MSWPFTDLDLPGDADERAIKRAYARKLKTLRPDEDAEGFQRLHEAYREALRISAWRASAETMDDASDEENADVDADVDADAGLGRSGDAIPSRDSDGEPPGDADQADADGNDGMDTSYREAWRPIAMPDLSWPSVSPSLGADAVAVEGMRAFASRAIAMAAASAPELLTEWLQTQPELWSLTGKHAAAQAVVDALHRTQPALAAAQFDALTDFFGLCDLRGVHDAHSMLVLRDRLVLAHALDSGDLQALAARAAQDGGSRAANLRQARRLLAQLRMPLSWPQAVWVSLMPGLPTQLRRFALSIRGMSDGYLPAGVSPEQAAFWEDAGDDTRWSWPRATMLSARLLVYPLLASLLAWLLLRDEGTTTEALANAAQRYLMLASALGLGWVWLRSTLAFAQWQAVEDPPERHWPRRLRGLAIPLLLAVALWLHFAPGTELWSWVSVPSLAAGTVARVAGSSYSLQSLVLLLRRGWLWFAVPCALAVFGAFADSGFVRSAVFLGLVVACIGLWYGARAKD